MAKHERRPATDDEIRIKILTVIWSYPTQGAAWGDVIRVTQQFLKDLGMVASREDVERVAKGLNLRKRTIGGNERYFAPVGMSREELTRILYGG